MIENFVPVGKLGAVYKYKLEGGEHAPDGRGVECWVSMPRGARVLSVGAQGGDLVVWALVDTTAFSAMRHFRVFGTGWHVDATVLHAGWRFLGTVQMPGDVQMPDAAVDAARRLGAGDLVFHVWTLDERNTP